MKASNRASYFAKLDRVTAGLGRETHHNLSRLAGIGNVLNYNNCKVAQTEATQSMTRQTNMESAGFWYEQNS